MRPRAITRSDGRCEVALIVIVGSNQACRSRISERRVKALFRIARKGSLWYLAAVIALVAGIFLPSPAAKAASNYITASGTSLMLNGQPFQYIGFNTGMEGTCWDGNNWSTAQMDTYFSKLPPNGMTRIFTVQNGGTSIVSQIVTEAAKYNQHLILVLGDDNSNCSDTDGSPGGAGSGKTLAFYQSGWRGNYLSWVNSIVPMFANNPTIAMWEIANEPFHTGATNVALATMESYVSGAAAAVRADDPNHLISVAPADTDDLGGIGNYTSVMSDPNINVLDFHDYAWDYQNGAEVSSNFSQVQSAAQQLGKPFMVDEAGVEAGTGCTPTPGASNAGLTLQGRVTYLITKANDYLSSGASGIAFWDYEQDGSNCSYEMLPPNDPMIAAVQSYGGSVSSEAPAVVTGSASAITSTGATLAGTVNPEGADAHWHFDWGTTTAYGNVAPSSAGDAGSGTSAVNESTAITGLSPSTTYHFRIEATNSTGTTYGTDVTFTTSSGSQSTSGQGITKVATDSSGDDVFFVGPGGAVEQDSYAGGAWHGPVAIGGTATGGIATTDDGSIVYFVGAGGAIDNDEYSDGAWHGPYPIGGTGSGPIATMGDGTHVYFAATNGTVMNDLNSGGNWQGPVAIGGSI
jgi:hypothetical protein